jgi:hypothetical protein
MTVALYDSLVTYPDQARELISQLDSTTPATRQAVLETVYDLLTRFVQPAAPLLAARADDPAHLYFDLPQIAGSDLSGLVLGLLTQDFPALQEPPDDRDLAAVLDAYGIAIPTARQRAAFFRAWMAGRAAQLTRLLLPPVEHNLPHDPGANAAELAILQRILSLRLPGIERYLIESVLKKRTARDEAGAGLDR